MDLTRLTKSRNGRGLCANEAELVELCAKDPEAARTFDVKRGWKATTSAPKGEADEVVA